MNEAKVLTVRNISFTDDEGKQVQGQQLWLLMPTVEPQWNGYEVLKCWIPTGHSLEATVYALKHGDDVIVEFNRRGKLCTLQSA